MRCFFKQTNEHGKKRDSTTGGCFDVEDSSPKFSQRDRKHHVFLRTIIATTLFLILSSSLVVRKVNKDLRS